MLFSWRINLEVDCKSVIEKVLVCRNISWLVMFGPGWDRIFTTSKHNSFLILPDKVLPELWLICTSHYLVETPTNHTRLKFRKNSFYFVTSIKTRLMGFKFLQPDGVETRSEAAPSGRLSSKLRQLMVVLHTLHSSDQKPRCHWSARKVWMNQTFGVKRGNIMLPAFIQQIP